MDYHTLVTLDCYILVTLEGRNKDECDFSLYVNFNRRIFGVYQNINVCFSKALQQYFLTTER